MTLAQQIGFDYVQPKKWQPKSLVGVPDSEGRTVARPQNLIRSSWIHE